MLLGWIDRPRGSLGCMEETFLVFLIPNSRYLFFVFLFFDFLKMVLPSMFDFIGDFYLYNFFLSLTIPNNTRSFRSTNHSSHLACFCFLQFVR